MTPSLASVLSEVLETRLRDLHVALPGRIVSYDASKQVADVEPLVMAARVNEAGETVTEPLPVLPAVPVAFPGGGGFRLTFPVAPGDGCLVVFSSAAIGLWQTLGGLQPPDSLRRHHLADAVCWPGLHADTAPWAGASTTAATLGSNSGPGVLFKPTTVELGARDGDVVTERLILGDTYRAREAVLHASLQTALAGAAAALAAAAAGFTALGAAAPAAAVAATASAAACTSAAAQVAQAAADVAAFEALAATFLSALVKTR